MKETKKQSNGLVERWYSNGVKSYSANYKDGKRDGLSEWWYSNGVKSYSANFKAGEKHGLAEGWHSNGVKAYSTNYKDGKKHGLAKGYENGIKAYSTNYKDGKKHGLAEGWNESGDMDFRVVYDNDKLVKPLSVDISLQEAIDNGEIADLSLELQDLVKHAANGCIKRKGKMKDLKIGTVFEYEEGIFAIAKKVNKTFNCTKCVVRQCSGYACLGFQREDETAVYFPKATEKEIEDYKSKRGE